MTTIRSDGTEQSFAFVSRPDFLEIVEELPELHAFMVYLSLDGRETIELMFGEHDHSDMDLGDEEDAHA